MRWKDGRRSDNVEDRRRMSPGKKAAVGVGGGGILIMLIAMLFGADPSKLMQMFGGGTARAKTQQVENNYKPSPEEDELAEMVKVVLGSTEDVFAKLFRQKGKTYKPPVLVLFTQHTVSDCGQADAGTGPFYCPADQKIYIDLSFYKTMRDQLGADGDFAQAYVIAHEVGHHVQNLLGKSRMVLAQRGRVSQAEYNNLSVRLELQADFYAGVWAHQAQKANKILQPGDLEEALRAARAIGDDRLQKRSKGYVQPETFTHGTSEQRARWFRKGLTSGDMDQGDTFSARNL